MELKQLRRLIRLSLARFYSYLYGIETRQSQQHEDNLTVLLVPLWNWNKVAAFIKDFDQSFYSYLYGIETNNTISVSLELNSFTRTFMELKLRIISIKTMPATFYSYLYGIETSQGSAKISKTFWFYSYLYGIETKQIQQWRQYQRRVLLVPLWNWN